MDPVTAKTKAEDIAVLVAVGDRCKREGDLREAVLWHRKGATRGEAALAAAAKDLARIAELIRDEWPTPQHKQGCSAAFGEYRCRCGLAEEIAARDEALRLCQLDSADDTL